MWVMKMSERGCDQQILDEIRSVVETGYLPDGDHTNLPTMVWLEELLQRYDESSANKP